MIARLRRRRNQGGLGVRPPEAGKLRGKELLLLAALMVVALVLDGWQRSPRHGGERMWLDNVVCASALPFQSTLAGGLRWAEDQWQALAQARQVWRENKRLSAKVGELQGRLSQLEESYAETAREKTVRQKYAAASKGRMARVIATGSGGWLSYLVVSGGSAAGTRVKDVALTADGVVGQVYAVAGNSARVVPITDGSSKVAALVKDSRETGILVGTGGRQCELRFLAPNAEVRPGAMVLTAGTGGVFPKGLPLGTVASVGPEPRGVGKRAMVDPAVQFRKLEEVLLVRGAGL